MSAANPERDWWKSDKKRKAVFRRLKELGVDVDFKEYSLTLFVPEKCSAQLYIEVGYLFAQLGDEDFPDDFYQGISGYASKVFRQKTEFYPAQPIIERDWEYCMRFHFFLKEGLRYKKRGIESDQLEYESCQYNKVDYRLPPLNQTDSLSGSDLSGKDFGAGLTFEETDIQGTGIRKIRTEPLQAEFVFISPGEFVMGDGGERHRVILTKGFFMQTTPVTQRQWKEMAGSNPSQFRDCDDCPVETVSWNDVNKFVSLLNRKAGPDRFRLPTEAEWEYACRAGSETAYCFGDDHRHLGKYAWFDRNSGEKTHPVAQKKPNAWGLYDMHGNVCEWCQDWYDYYSEMTVTDPVGDSSGYRRIFRGGSWKFDAQRSRSAYRGMVDPDTRHPVLGFRLVLMS